MRLSDFVVSFVADRGVQHVFMLPGGGCMYLVDSLGRERRLRFVVNLHEQASAIAAEAYAQCRNDLGVALVTTGPGGTNAITGVAAAWLDSTPCLFLSGQVKRADIKDRTGVRQFGFQEVGIVELVRSITKYAVTVMEPESIRFHLEKACHLATTGRPGPVWVDIPLDVQGAEIDPEALPRFTPPAVAPPPSLQEHVSRAIGVLNAAERPVVLVGNGVRLARGEAELHEALDLLGVPVLTTWKALDLVMDDHPLYCGRPGAVGQRGANFTQQNADAILTIGARLDLGQTAYSHAGFAPHARKIVVDADAAEIGKLDTPVEVPVVADARAFLVELLAQRDRIARTDRTAWLARCRAWQERYPVVLAEYRERPGGVSIYSLVDALSQVLADGDVLVPGSSGACSEVTMQAFRMRRRVRVFNSEGLGPMGFGIAGALGGCLASGGRRTVCIDGDGGFWMNIQDLETVRRLDLPIKFFVLNNAGYGSIQATQDAHFAGHRVACDAASGLTLPDVERACAGFGVPTARLADTRDLENRLREWLEAPGPMVCEVLVEPRQATAPRVSSTRLPDGRMVSRPMEDLWPFLDRDELQANLHGPARPLETT
jgi:acetolactate synthase I/II/III large subunit